MTEQSKGEVVTYPPLCEPFINGRDTGRLLHDLGAMLSLLNPKVLSFPILDFGAGSCWITEAVARMGHKVTAFDIHTDLAGCIGGRLESDRRIDPSLIDYASGDGHDMPFKSGTFGHTLCYDTLHHMRDYEKVFAEFSRVLIRGGRAIFVEPGAKHATSSETIAFLKLKSHDPTWIERNVVLEEINQCASAVGLGELNIIPIQHPGALISFPLRAWLKYRDGDRAARDSFARHLATINYDQRIVFYCDKPD